MAEVIKIEGIREFQASLKAMDGNSQKQLRLVFNAAADLVVKKAEPMVPHKSGRAASSLKKASTQREARVGGGSSKAPYYPWLDFGGRVGKHNSVSRPFVKKGRYMYPAYDASKPEVEQELAKGLEKLVTDSGLALD